MIPRIRRLSCHAAVLDSSRSCFITTNISAKKYQKKQIRTKPRAPVALSLPLSPLNGSRAGGKEKESGLVAQPGDYLMPVC